MKQYLGNHNYRSSSFVFKDEESYYNFKINNVVLPSDYDVYGKKHGEVVTYSIRELEENK